MVKVQLLLNLNKFDKKIFIFYLLISTCLTKVTAEINHGTKIVCDKGLICQNQQCKSRGDVKIFHNQYIILSKEMNILFSENGGLKEKVEKIKLIKDVKIEQKGGTLKAYCDSANYNSAQDKMILQGNPKIINDEMNINVANRINMFRASNKITSKGRVTLKHNNSGRLILADHLMINLHEDGGGIQKIRKVKIWDNVTISTQEEIIKADKGIYQSDRGILELYDNIRVTRKNGQLFGKYALYNINNGTLEVHNDKDRIEVLLVK